MSFMFTQTALKNIVLPFNTSSVENMRAMFMGAQNLRNEDLHTFNTSNVNDMACMFAACASLTNLDISNFTTSSETDIDGMFTLSGIKVLDISGMTNFYIEPRHSFLPGNQHLGADMVWNCTIKDDNDTKGYRTEDSRTYMSTILGETVKCKGDRFYHTDNSPVYGQLKYLNMSGLNAEGVGKFNARYNMFNTSFDPEKSRLELYVKQEYRSCDYFSVYEDSDVNETDNKIDFIDSWPTSFE